MDGKNGRFDICFSGTSLNCFSETPRKVHLKRLVKIFGYFEDTTRRWKIIVISPEDIKEIIDKGANNTNWLEKCPDVTEDIAEGLPEPQGCPISTKI